MQEKILLVEDHEGLRRALQEFLEDEGLCVLIACSGEEALNVLGAESVDMVLTDQDMPGITGEELTEHICIKWPKMPVIIQSAGFYKHEIQDLNTKAASNVHYRMKDDGPQALLALIQELLGKEVI